MDTTRARRWGAAAAAVGALSLAAAWAPWTFSTPALRAEVAARLREATGLDMPEAGRVVVSLLPRPRVKVEDLRLVDPSGALDVTVEVLKADLALGALAVGRVRLGATSLLNPVVSIDLGRLPVDRRAPLARLRALVPGDGADAWLGALTIVDGAASVRRADGRQEAFDRLNLALAWPARGDAGTLAATFEWRGTLATLRLWLGRPGEMLDGGASPLAVALSSPLGTATLDGRVAGGPAPHLEGRIEVGVPASAALARMLDLPALPEGGDGPLALRGDAKSSRNGIELANLALRLGRNAFEGSLQFRLDEGRPMLSGTLAAADLMLDLPRVLDEGTAARLGKAAGSALSWLPRADLDLRVSAARLQVGPLAFSDAAVAALAKAGRLELSLAQMEGYRGAVKGRVSLTSGAMGVEARGTVGVAGLELGPALAALGLGGLTGTATAQIGFETQGGTPAQALRHLEGRATVSLRDGELGGFDIEQALRRAERRTLPLALDLRRGRTAYSTASATLRLARGTAEVVEAALAGPGVVLWLGGSVDLVERTLALRALAVPGGPVRPEAPRLPFVVTGPWGEPAIRSAPTAVLPPPQAP